MKEKEKPRRKWNGSMIFLNVFVYGTMAAFLGFFGFVGYMSTRPITRQEFREIREVKIQREINRLLQNYDVNRNGILERDEIRQYIIEQQRVIDQLRYDEVSR